MLLADFKRCNGQVINALGPRLGHTLTHPSSHSTPYSRGESWTSSHRDTRWKKGIWKRSDKAVNCAEEQASHEDCKQETLELMEERVRAGRWSEDLLITHAWEMNGGVPEDPEEKLTRWWERVEGRLEGLGAGQDVRVED